MKRVIVILTAFISSAAIGAPLEVNCRDARPIADAGYHVHIGYPVGSSLHEAQLDELWYGGSHIRLETLVRVTETANELRYQGNQFLLAIDLRQPLGPGQYHGHVDATYITDHGVAQTADQDMICSLPPTTIKALNVEMFGRGPAVDQSAYLELLGKIGGYVADLTIDKFLVYGHGIEGGASLCIELNPFTRATIDAVKADLETITPDPNSTSYSVTAVAGCRQ